MMVPLLITIVAAVVCFTVGLVIGFLLRNASKTAGRLVIDKTGESDRWTFVLDEAIEDVENEDAIKLRIEKHE